MSLEDSTGDDEEKTRSHGVISRKPLAEQYLLVFEEHDSYVFPLPKQGVVIVGRSEDADLQFPYTDVSRQHARISVSEAGGVTAIVDLGSSNGTLVNGKMLSSEAALASGDIITIGAATLSFHDSKAIATSWFVEFSELRKRASDEIERSLRFEREFGVLCLALGAKVKDRGAFGKVIAPLRQVDLATWVGDSELFILMPEIGEDRLTDAAAQQLQALGAEYPEVRIGRAVCPIDGTQVDALIAGARAAAMRAAPRTVESAPRISSVKEIGDRKVIVADPKMVRLYALLERVAQTDLPVLISGETGTGKELAARTIHVSSVRATKPLVTLNCAAIAENLVESELFGHAKGAFSGAVATKVGLLESASGGTVFLDEIGELSAATQAKLLRALESKMITRVGDLKERPIDVRLVGATNRDLQAEIAAGNFRKDLYFRLSGALVTLPPLRERHRELQMLAELFLSEACERAGREPMAIAPEVRARFESYHWPGNVRELKLLMDYAAAVVLGDILTLADIEDRLEASSESPTSSAEDRPSPRSRAATSEPFQKLSDEIAELEKTRIAEALAATDGNQTQAAKLLGMPVRTLYNKVKKYDLGRD